MVKIKICGLFRQEDIAFANEAMPDYIGFVFAKSRRRVTFQEAARLRAGLKEGILPVGVFVNAEVEDIARLHRRGTIACAQLHGGEGGEYIRRLRKLSKVPIIKAVWMDGETAAADCEDAGADYLLFDNGAGGSGETFDWGLVPETRKPFFVAGGLHAGNLGRAVETLRPYAVDLSSGVETRGLKDKQKILDAVRSVRHG